MGCSGVWGMFGVTYVVCGVCDVGVMGVGYVVCYVCVRGVGCVGCWVWS